MDKEHADRQPVLTDGRQSPTALLVQRGVMRELRARFDVCCFAEVGLAGGRRADIVGVGANGEIWIIEIKSSAEDFRVDVKWPEYKAFCDRFYFAKPGELEPGIFPADEGLIVADSYGADIVREAEVVPLAGARRKAMLVRLARLGGDRIHALMDPGSG
jgi:hypothetical protein